MQPTAPLHARVADWPQRFGDLVAQRLTVPFVWGSNDCAAWVADAVAAQHGHDTLAELRGTRRNWREAKRQIKRGGGYAAAMARAGLPSVAPALAQRGDVVLLLQPDGPQALLAVCNGVAAMCPSHQGLVAAPMAHAVAAWRV